MEKRATKEAETIDTEISFRLFSGLWMSTRVAKKRRENTKRAPCLFSYPPSNHSGKERIHGKNREIQGIRKSKKREMYKLFWIHEKCFHQKKKP
jgi:hypothetical protein